MVVNTYFTISKREWDRLQAKADRRGRLLKELHDNIVEYDITCPVCSSFGCSEDCELAKELNNA